MSSQDFCGFESSVISVIAARMGVEKENLMVNPAENKKGTVDTPVYPCRFDSAGRLSSNV